MAGESLWQQGFDAYIQGIKESAAPPSTGVGWEANQGRNAWLNGWRWARVARPRINDVPSRGWAEMHNLVASPWPFPTDNRRRGDSLEEPKKTATGRLAVKAPTALQNFPITGSLLDPVRSTFSNPAGIPAAREMALQQGWAVTDEWCAGWDALRMYMNTGGK